MPKNKAFSEKLNSKILSLPGVVKKRSKYGSKGEAYYIDVREFAHFHSESEIDLRLTRKYQKIHRNLLGDERVISRQSPSDWIAVTFKTHDDVNYVFELLKLAWDANRVEVLKR
jgi:hypothetical protein